ncbi:MAG: HdeD family acid-resistance protein [Frankiaceae bacterium]
MTTHGIDVPTKRFAADSESPLRQVGEQVGRLWWVPLAAGLLSIGLGLAILVSDWTVHALVVAAGAVLVLRGLALAFHPAFAADGAFEQVVAGLVGVVAGVVLIAWPKPTLLVLAVIAGAWLALSGTLHILMSVARRKHLAQWWLSTGIGVVELLLGVWVMRRPEVTLSLVVTVIGLWTVLTGVACCVQALEIRSALEER